MRRDVLYSTERGVSPEISTDQFSPAIFVFRFKIPAKSDRPVLRRTFSSGKMEGATPSVLCSLFVIMLILLIPDTSVAEPRSQIIQLIRGNRLTASVPNFVGTMETLSEQVRARGYGVAVTGTRRDATYGISQCYGDLSLLDCVLCFSEARTVLPQCFPYNGRIYLDGCFMRVENYMFYDQYLGPEDMHVCGNRTTKGTLFQQNARQAIQQAVVNAPTNNGTARAQASVPGPSNETAYVLANCWKTLSANSCAACLQNASASMLGCLPWSEGRALYTGCFMRYSDTNFLNAISASGGSSSRGKVVVIVIVVVSSVVVLGAAAFVGFSIWKNKQIQKKRKGAPTPFAPLVTRTRNLRVGSANDVKKLVKILDQNNLNFKYSTLDKATGSFDEANKLGQGGFGTVYKGVLADGREIAVKRLFFNNKHTAADFYNEVNIISSVQHKNLTRLLGCSCSGTENLLVYELLPNQSLDRFIFDPIKGKALNWKKRFEIIIGTAEGLVYLHENTETRIIHRDIKASNILLDSRLRAKIADFGLARSFQEDKSHISTVIAGTLGYMAPEYLARGQLTEKADVYSFGVLLLEIVTGRQNNKRKNAEYTVSLVSDVWEHFQRGIVEELFDLNLMLHNYHTINVKNEVARVLHVGLLCTQEIPSLRPAMSKALQMFVKKDEELPPPTNPPFVDEKTMELHDPWESSSSKMEGATPSVLCSQFVVMLILLLPDTSVAEPRSQIIQLICGNKSTVSVPNFVGTMETLSEQVRARGYGVAVTGTGPDATYGISQCYGDLSLIDCVLCFSEARTLFPQCFPYNGARIYLDGCFMRAENYSFYDEYLGPEDRRVCGNRTTKGSLFQQNARAAVQQAVANAPSNNGYARSQVSFPRDSNDTAYVLADCWKTLSANSCAACLQNASASMLRCLPWSKGRALYTGCFMRYSDTNFLNAITTNGGSSSRGKVVVTIIVVSSVVVLGVGAFIGIGVWKNKLIQKKRKGANDAEKLVKILHDISLNFKYSTLDKATGSFDEANKLGQGGFGTVYKGVLADGREIAVKRLFFNNKHRVAGPESLLVYEFLPNQSLDRFIFDPIKGKALNWEKRFEIIIGTAEGLVYLHENTKTRIIHRDIKASNILLDSRLRAKIADFGLARGYMAPEYLAHGQLTEKADVYSFGVLLLEIVTGKQNNKRKNDEDTVSLVSDVWEHFERGIVEELFDPNLMLHNCHTINVQNEVARVLHVGLLCTQEIPTLRPFMPKALKMLVKKDEELPPPTKPPFVDEKTMELHDPWEDYSIKQGNSSSVANLSHSSFYPR
ncbi:hypothetical protein MTR67_000398 [Solanum verrucosum]|uniref:Cysteine-rich receptor-like protein kinase 2 n=1 Tax=Solanum verrucosum TaxID=315347 RepID=A0AAF0T7F3_SOLVR|nr:hypothetical protein MTR67_000398 [Solanum verrucosum]